MPPLGKQTLCLFVESDRVAHGDHLHGLVASRETEAESWFHQSSGQGRHGRPIAPLV